MATAWQIPEKGHLHGCIERVPQGSVPVANDGVKYTCYNVSGTIDTNRAANGRETCKVRYSSSEKLVRSHRGDISTHSLPTYERCEKHRQRR